jgi:hypothetical protein
LSRRSGGGGGVDSDNGTGRRGSREYVTSKNAGVQLNVMRFSKNYWKETKTEK